MPTWSGFQRPLGAQNFLRLTRHLLGLRPRGNVVEVDGREVSADAFPISIDVGEIERLAVSPMVRERAAAIRAELGNPKTIILGVDRLDYTKGIESRIKAFRELLAEGKLSVPEAVMVQVATPSRERVEQYRTLRAECGTRSRPDQRRLRPCRRASGALPAPVVQSK